jgi:SAM-dependent methyltransferase
MQTRWNDDRFTTDLESYVWTASPVVRRYLHVLASGDAGCDWLTYVEFHHLAPALDRALVLGCGASGWLERALAGRHRFRSIVACDFAQDSVERARARAEEAGVTNIDYRVLDLERDSLDGPYDAIFANDVLHHIADLEGLYLRIDGALKSSGKFIFNEYVGPNRFQYSDERIDLVNRYFRLLPDRLRLDHVTGQVLWRRERIDRDKVEREDPTEAVRSEEVLPLARRFFKTDKEYPYGGGLLNPLLFGVVSNFRDGAREDDGYLELLCGAEERLTRSGALDPDFFIYAGGKGRPSVGRAR